MMRPSSCLYNKLNLINYAHQTDRWIAEDYDNSSSVSYSPTLDDFRLPRRKTLRKLFKIDG